MSQLGELRLVDTWDLGLGGQVDFGDGGLLAVQILAVGDARLQGELKKFKVRLMEESRAKNKNLA